MTFTNDVYNQLHKLISLKSRAKTRQNTIDMSINRQTDKLRQKQTNLRRYRESRWLLQSTKEMSKQIRVSIV